MLFRAVAGEITQLQAGTRGSCLACDRETSSVGCGIPAFIGKSSAAPTRLPSAGASRRSAEADPLQRGGAAFMGGGKSKIQQQPKDWINHASVVQECMHDAHKK